MAGGRKCQRCTAVGRGRRRRPGRARAPGRRRRSAAFARRRGSRGRCSSSAGLSRSPSKAGARAGGPSGRAALTVGRAVVRGATRFSSRPGPPCGMVRRVVRPEGPPATPPTHPRTRSCPRSPGPSGSGGRGCGGGAPAVVTGRWPPRSGRNGVLSRCQGRAGLRALGWRVRPADGRTAILDRIRAPRLTQCGSVAYWNA